jgi:hypothetical protein
MSTLDEHTTALAPVIAPRLNHAQLLGAWRNTDAGASGGILRLAVTELEGRLRLRVFGAARPAPYDWGEIEVSSYAATPTSTTAWAFTAHYDFGHLSTTISAYTKAGILILTTYNRFTQPDGRAPYWTREFFYRDESLAEPTGPPYGVLTRDRDRLDGVADRPAPRVDLAPLVATWRSFDLGSTRVARVQITARDGILRVRPHGVWTPRRHDWHEAAGFPFAEDVALREATAFTASFDLYLCRVEMVGYVNRRLITFETGSTFVDGSGQSPYFTREHFYPS